MSFVVALTGHREEDIVHDQRVLGEFVRRDLERFSPSLVICGMANGFDLIGGIAALDAGIPVLAAKPWTTHQPRVADRDAYARIMREAEDVYPVTEADDYPGPWVYHARNHFMVDECDRVYAYWNGKRSGGTFRCLEYAKSPVISRPVRNVFRMVPR